jgi:hypothetical protein
LPDCPAPERPRLALIDGALPFDNPANVAVFLERDDVLRLYVRALEATITCFRREQKTAKGKE